MSDLKTLKDFDCKGCYCKLAPKLKAEAIKWVKIFEFGTPSGLEIMDSKTREWIKYFFNLTEEDLKEKEDD